MKKLTAIILTMIILFSLCSACAEVGDRGEFYPLLTVVTGFERIDGQIDTQWIITCTDRFGRDWAFYGEETDAHIGNLYNLLMWNMGEETEEADEIIEVYYEGRLEAVEMTHFLTGNE